MKNWFHRWLGIGQDRDRFRYRPIVEGLEERVLLATPVIDAIPDKTVPSGKSLIIPITATGGTVNYTVNKPPQVTATVHTGNPFLKLSVQNFGDMTFQLFQDLVPNTVAKITDLVNNGFYNNLTFHRVVPNFVIQGGDPNGNGTGGPGFQFDDEFDLSAIFDGDGQLAMANSGPDTNGSQFFITIGQQRFLDFNHTIFGQLIRGFDVRDKISQVPRDAQDKPTTPVVITSASLISDPSDAVLTVTVAAGFTGSNTIVVTGSNSDGSASQNFSVTGVADQTNDPPFLGPVQNQTTTANTPVTFNLTGLDLENDPLDFAVVPQDNPAHVTINVNGSQVTLTPDAGFAGTVNLLAKVKDRGATNRGSRADPFDTQKFTLTVTGTPPPPPPPPQQPARNGTNQGFVTQTYRDALGRDPETGGMNFYMGLLSNGTMNRPAVAKAIQTSAEARNRQVTTLYVTLLNRQPDATGLNLSLKHLQAGGSLLELRRTIAGSPEYFQSRGRGNNGGFLTALYQDALGRAVDPIGQAGAGAALANGFDRGKLAAMVFTSDEGYRRQVQGFYTQYLQRPADEPGLKMFVARLAKGEHEESIIADIEGSAESFGTKF